MICRILRCINAPQAVIPPIEFTLSHHTSHWVFIEEKETMNRILFAALAMAAVTSAGALAADLPQRSASKPTAVPAVIAYSGSCCAYTGSYYSTVYNPRFGYVPELGYSNAVSFRIYPHSD